MTFIIDNTFSLKDSFWRKITHINPRDWVNSLRIKSLKFRQRFSPDVMHIFNFSIDFRDSLSLYMELKDIFLHRIYHFSTPESKPVIVDAGSFIGISVLYFKSVYPQARILCFEPDKLALYFLRRNISQNRLRYVRVIPAALGSKEGSAFFLPTGTDSSHLQPGAGVKVPLVRLSRFITSPVDFLKLNIEGSELEVLSDLESSDRLKFIRQLCLEWHSFPRSPQNLDQVLSLLTRNGFSYLINHFDYESNSLLRPPFTLTPSTRYFLLVYGRRLSQP